MIGRMSTVRSLTVVLRLGLSRLALGARPQRLGHRRLGLGRLGHLGSTSAGSASAAAASTARPSRRRLAGSALPRRARPHRARRSSARSAAAPSPLPPGSVSSVKTTTSAAEHVVGGQLVGREAPRRAAGWRSDARGHVVVAAEHDEHLALAPERVEHGDGAPWSSARRSPKRVDQAQATLVRARSESAQRSARWIIFFGVFWS